MTQQEIDTIHAWLDSGRNYAEGLKLFIQYSKNQGLKLVFTGRENRYAGKLAYELGKLIQANPDGQPTVQKKVKPGGLNKPWPDSVDLQEILPGGQDLPPIIARIIAEFSDLYKSRSIAHKSLKAIPPDNRSENVEYRRIIVEKIRAYSDRMEELHHYHEEFNTKNIIPDPGILYPLKKKAEEKPTDLETLTRLRYNLYKSLSRYDNILNFQAKTRQPVKNPMPAGPKRTALLSRIKESKTELAKLDYRIHGINKVLASGSTGNPEK